MPKFKGKASRSKSPAGPRGGGGGGGGYVGCDAALVPRVREFLERHDARSVDDVCEHLRARYREYQRKPALVFRRAVERACEEVQRRGEERVAAAGRGGGAGGGGGDAAPATTTTTTSGNDIDALEAAHLSARGLKMAGEGDDDDDDEEEEEEEEDSGEEEEDDDDDDDSDSDSESISVDDGAADADDLVGTRDAMNTTLAKLYSTSRENSSDKLSAKTEEKEKEKDGAAFAAPHLVAAASRRALGGGAAAAAGDARKDKDAAATPPPPLMSAAEAGHLAAVATARAARLKQAEDSRTRRGRRSAKKERLKRKRGGGWNGNGNDFDGDHDFIEDALPGGKKYRPGGRNGNGAQVDDPFGFGDGSGGGGKDVAMTTPSTPRDVRLEDLGGIEESLTAIRELILCPLTHPELYGWLGVDPPRGVLLHGPPGCGKTTLAHAIAREAGVPFFSIAATEIVAGVSGESEAKIRQLFAAAAQAAPSIVFIDEIDAIVPKRDSAARQMESRIVAQLLASMDNLIDGAARVTSSGGGIGEDPGERLDDDYAGGPEPIKGHVTVIGATNRPDGMDAALRRAGRFDREIMLGVPDEAARARILAVQAKKLRCVLYTGSHTTALAW